MAPLKEVFVTPEDRIELGYWKGNDALKGSPQVPDLSAATPWPSCQGPFEWTAGLETMEIRQPRAGAVVVSTHGFDCTRGIILEGTVVIEEEGKPWASGGLLIETEKDVTGTAILMETRGRVEIGDLLPAIPEQPTITRFVQVVMRRHPCRAGKAVAFRMLLRGRLFEFYLRDRLIQCYTLDRDPTGRIGWIVESGLARFSGIKVWGMTLD